MANDSDWISKYRVQVTSWLTALNALLALREQWDALDYSNSLTAEDFAGGNSDIDLAKLTAAVSSIEALNATFAQGHNTNLYALIL